MLEFIIGWSIRQRWLVICLGLLLALWGLYAVSNTPMDAVPDLSENQVLIYCDWVGHSPVEIDRQITAPLTTHLSSIPGIRVVRGSSDIGSSLIHVIFEDGLSWAAARNRVQQRLAEAGNVWPAGVSARLAPDAIPTGQIFWYTVEGSGFDLVRLRALQEWTIAPQLRAIPGVAEIASVGGFAAEYQIDLEPERLHHFGLSAVDVARMLEQSNQPIAANILVKSNAEYVAHVTSTLSPQDVSGDAPDSSSRSATDIIRQLEQIVLATPNAHSINSATGNSLTVNASTITLGDIAQVHLGVRSRRGMLEKDGNEVVGGVVMLRQGHNPLEVTRQLKQKLGQIQVGLPDGVRVIACYDRTPLIEGAVRTVTATLTEAVITSTLCVLLVLLHLRTSLVIAVAIPLAALSSFVMMWCLRWLGWVDIQTNIMSLAGIAISIGVLVDSSIVMAENVMHRLQLKFGEQPVRGDVRESVRQACCTVGRPMFFSIVIMLLSFLPVFALSGMDGKLFHPLAFTKTFALIAVACLSITLIPALCTILIRGRLRPESDSWIVRSVSEVYRPVLESLLLQPAPLFWLLAATLILGTLPLGVRWVFFAVLGGSLIGMGCLTQRRRARFFVLLSLVMVALIGDGTMQPLGTEVRMPLNEGMVMDMPITIPRASVTQSGDDLKARDMQLCRFPEVHMVIGKAGRVDSPFDPAPLDMIETMIEFRPEEWWPRRKISQAEVQSQTEQLLHALRAADLLGTSEETTDSSAIEEAVTLTLQRFDALMREYAYQRHQEFLRGLGTTLTEVACDRLWQLLRTHRVIERDPTLVEKLSVLDALSTDTRQQLAMSPQGLELGLIYRRALHRTHEIGVIETDLTLNQNSAILDLGRHVGSIYRSAWKSQVIAVDQEIRQRAPEALIRIAAEELAHKLPVIDPAFREVLDQIVAARRPRPADQQSAGAPITETHHGGKNGPLPLIDPHAAWDEVRTHLANNLAGRLVLVKNDANALSTFGGELDTVLQMPGWTNVWTKPIQNRVDMLATGVNTEVGVRVLGSNLDDVVSVSEQIAEVLRTVPGAADVVADPIRGKGYLDVRIDLAEAASHKIPLAELNGMVELALGGKQVGSITQGRESRPIRLRLAPQWTRDEESLADLPLTARLPQPAPLPQPATVRPPASDSKATASAASSMAHTSPPGDHAVRSTVRLSDVADIGITEGPATVKREQGWLRNYVRLNVRNRDILEFLPAAQAAVTDRVHLPEGIFIEWTGQFEHTLKTARTLFWVMPLVIILILAILYWTYRDWGDAWMMLLAVPGALAGGVLFQWLFGYRFSIPVAVGYIACFGMVTSTGIIMLVYLREAVEKAGGLERLTPETLRVAVLNGAVHRLRPKLLTEGTTILGLAPMLWASGVGAEVIRPMAAPVLGGILLADEVIDLLLPVLFYWSRLKRLPKTAELPSTSDSEASQNT
jgi:Cu(I)/Ag(I) efflux system membrane protein CusA/SilA